MKNLFILTMLICFSGLSYGQSAAEKLVRGSEDIQVAVDVQLSANTIEFLGEEVDAIGKKVLIETPIPALNDVLNSRPHRGEAYSAGEYGVIVNLFIKWESHVLQHFSILYIV